MTVASHPMDWDPEYREWLNRLILERMEKGDLLRQAAAQVAEHGLLCGLPPELRDRLPKDQNQ